MTDARCQPKVASVPVCCYCDAALACEKCGREQPPTPTPSAQTVTADDEHWALLYLHDWDPPKEGQEHKWEPGKNVFPEISGVFGTMQEAQRTSKNTPEKYWVCRVRFTPKQIATLTSSHAAASARIGELETLLERFAKRADMYAPSARDDCMVHFRLRDCKAARAALSRTEEGR